METEGEGFDKSQYLIEFFDLLIRAAQYMGMYKIPYNMKFRVILMWWPYFLVVFILIPNIILTLLGDIFEDRSLEVVTQDVFACTCGMMALFKILAFRTNGPKVQLLIGQAKTLGTNILKSPDQNVDQLVNDAVGTARMFLKFMCILTLTAGSAFSLNPLIDIYTTGRRFTPFYFWEKAVDLQNVSFFEFVITYLYSSIFGLCTASYIACADVLLCTCMIMAAARFKILSYSLKNIGEFADEVFQNYGDEEMRRHARSNRKADISEDIRRQKSLEKLNVEMCDMADEIRKSTEARMRRFKSREEKKLNYMTQLLRRCIMEHKLVLRHIDLLEETFTMFLLMDAALNVGVMCLGLFGIDKVELMSFTFTKVVTVFFSCFGRIFFYCWFSSSIYEASTDVCTASYNCNWIVANQTFKCYLLMVMIRSQKPASLTLGGIYNMNMNTFISISKASYTYNTMLRETR